MGLENKLQLLLDAIVVKCSKYTVVLEDIGVSVVDFDIKDFIMSEISKSGMGEDESIRGALYLLLKDVHSIEYELYEEQDISIEMGIYDYLLENLTKYMISDGFVYFNKIEDDSPLGYSITSVSNCSNISDLSDTLLGKILSAFIVNLPYEVIYLK